jgi:hypothetical protein
MAFMIALGIEAELFFLVLKDKKKSESEKPDLFLFVSSPNERDE